MVMAQKKMYKISFPAAFFSRLLFFYFFLSIFILGHTYCVSTFWVTFVRTQTVDWMRLGHTFINRKLGGIESDDDEMEWYQNVHECEIDFYANELNTIKRWTKDSAAERERDRERESDRGRTNWIHSRREALTVCFVPTSGSIENRSNTFGLCTESQNNRDWRENKIKLQIQTT